MRELKFKYYFKVHTRKGVEVNEIILTLEEIQKRVFSGREEDCIAIAQFTGLKDCNGDEIYEGDALIDLDVELEDGVELIDTKQQVYWCQKDAAWKLDNTFVQDKSDGWLLSKDLNDYRFRIIGNMHHHIF